MELKTVRRKARKEFEKKSEEDKMKEMRAILNMVRTEIKHNEKIIKRLRRTIRGDGIEAQKIADMMEDKDFEGYKRRYHEIRPGKLDKYERGL